MTRTSKISPNDATELFNEIAQLIWAYESNKLARGFDKEDLMSNLEYHLHGNKNGNIVIDEGFGNSRFEPALEKLYGLKRGSLTEFINAFGEFYEKNYDSRKKYDFERPSNLGLFNGFTTILGAFGGIYFSHPIIYATESELFTNLAIGSLVGAVVGMILNSFYNVSQIKSEKFYALRQYEKEFTNLMNTYRDRIVIN